jgi:2-keto-4-pentenoate hydratase/2-oxohepta-3-ene-1,7-dioic acid hydratase in catechol pathway
MSASFVIPALLQASIAVAGDTKSFPVRRIWCVGRNYLEHIREMGNDERAPPFFFAKHPDMIEADGATIPYPHHSAPCSALQPASKIGHPAKGEIWLSVNGTQRQKGDLTELIWTVPEIIWQLSQQVEIGAGDIIMTGTPAGVAALSPGDKIECGVDGVGTLKVTIGKPAA